MKVTLKKQFFDNWRFFIALPAILWQSIFLFFPLIILLYTSLSLENYYRVFNLSHIIVILRSLVLASLNSYLCLIVAYPVAYFLSVRINRFKHLALFFLTLPFWINFLVHVYSWFFLLDRNGILNNFLIKINIIKEPIHILNTIGAVMVVMFHGYLPFMIMPIYTVLEKLDKRLIEASMDLGATRIYTLFKIVLPLSFSGVVAGFSLVYVLTFGDFVIPTLVGGGKTLFVGTVISDYFLSIFDFAQGSAFTFISAISLLIALCCNYLILKFLILNNYKRLK